jgi:hypothetical protein
MLPCWECRAPANREFDVPVYWDPAQAVTKSVFCFCSLTCKQFYCGPRNNLFYCIDCKRHIIGKCHGRRLDINKPELHACLCCYGRRILKSGQPHDDFIGHILVKMPDNKWISGTEIMLAGYTCIATTFQIGDIVQVAVNAIARNLDICLFFRDIPISPETALFARPSPQRARSAILTLCAGWHFDKDSAIGRLPRDVLGLLVQAVWTMRFDGAWLYK